MLKKLEGKTAVITGGATAPQLTDLWKTGIYVDWSTHVVRNLTRNRMRV